MGKLSLLLVGAAVFASLTLSHATRQIAGETSRNQAEAQADRLARQIAETGQSIVLTRMMGADGLQAPGFTAQAYGGGRFDVAVTLAPDRQTARVIVTGHYGAATHRIDGEYAFDPISYPGPIWLDVPFATSRITSGRPEIRGGATGLPVRFDRRRHDDLGLEELLRLADVVADLSADAVTAGSALDVPRADAWDDLLEDINVNGAEDLYQVALSAMTAADRTLAGPMTLTSRLDALGPTTITRVPGALTIGIGGRLTGEGVLLVEGGLVVESGGRLEWTGLVIVRSAEESLPVYLTGNVTVTGGLVVAQEAHPPIGHMDVTTFLDQSGMRTPSGNVYGPWWQAYRQTFPFYNHVHHWESVVSVEREVRFADTPTTRQEELLYLRHALQGAGSTPVYVEFGNPQYHGHATYRIKLNGEGGTINGMVRHGFPGDFRAASSPHRSVSFPANRLKTLVLDVQSLTSLRQRFDDEQGCDSWPLCIGRVWDRNGSLTVRIARASDDVRLYETAIYWHMRTDEIEEYEAELAAWRATIAAGAGFGTHLRFGPNARVRFGLAPILTLSDRLGFDRNDLRLLQATTRHASAADATPRGG